MSADDDPDIPESGAVFSFGKSNFADNIPSKFWIRNDPISEITCGEEHTAAITETGRVFVFGNNDLGQLGQGFPNCAIKPTCIKGLKQEKVVKIACGKSHTIAVTENGNFYGFGSNNEGQLGDGTSNEVNEPVLITNSPFSVRQVDCGADDSAFLTNDGRLYVFGNSWSKNGDSSPLELKLSCSVGLIACGYRHLALVTTNNKLYVIGPSERRNLDVRVDVEQQIGPVEGINEEMTKLSCGGKHTAVLTANGKLYTLGDGTYGQLGLGTRNLEAVSPKLVSGLEHLRLKDVQCGENHVAVISENGSLFVFGDGSHGKLGLDGENFSNQFWPAKVLNFRMYSVQKVSCGGHHTMVLARLRVPEEIQLYGEEDVEPFRSASVESNDNDVVVSTARNRRHKRDSALNTSLPPLKFPGKQLENEILSVKEAEDKKNVENSDEICEKMESDAMNENDENENDDGDDDVSEIVNFTDISDKQAEDAEKSMETIESEDETTENTKIPDEIVSFVNSQVNIVSVSNASKTPSSSDEEPSVDAEPSENIKGKRPSLTEKFPSRKSSFAFVNEDTESEEDEESDQSQVEESHVTREIANAISEKDLQEASNSKSNSEENFARKKKRGKTVFNRMFGKTKPDDDKAENIAKDEENKDEEEKTISTPTAAASPSKEPVPVITQSSLLCLPSKKIKLTQQENTENQSVTCTVM